VEPGHAVPDHRLARRGSDRVGAPGMAILSMLLSDGTGPAYRGSEPDLRRRLGEARALLRA
jgi:hypothetical protein